MGDFFGRTGMLVQPGRTGSADFFSGTRRSPLLPSITPGELTPEPGAAGPAREHYIFRVSRFIVDFATTGATGKILSANKNRIGLKIQFIKNLAAMPDLWISSSTPILPTGPSANFFTIFGSVTGGAVIPPVDLSIPPFGPQNALYASNGAGSIELIETIRVFGDDFFRGQE